MNNGKFFVFLTVRSDFACGIIIYLKNKNVQNGTWRELKNERLRYGQDVKFECLNLLTSIHYLISISF